MCEIIITSQYSVFINIKFFYNSLKIKKVTGNKTT